MSNDAQKADQIAFHFYTKLFHVVNEARATAEPKGQQKVDKWFNLETPDSDLFTKEARDKYKSISACISPPPPLEIQVLLTIPDLNHNQVLVYLAPDAPRLQIKPTPEHIVLEKWVLTFTPRDLDTEDSTDVALPTIYKHGIPLFRSLYSLLRILPAWKLCKRLRRRLGNNGLSIQLRIDGMNESDSGILGFESPTTPFRIQTHTFPSVPHPMGTLSLSATYLSEPTFRLDELESLLSSRFLSLDEGPEFVPTLVKNQQRDSISGSSPVGSLPIRTSLPKSKSPPSSITIAERFILPSRTTSTAGVSGSGSASISPRNVPVPISRPPTMPPHQGESGSAPGMGLSTSSRDDPISRLRNTTMTRSGTGTTGSSSDLPAGLPIPLRRPNINPVHPFKSNALSSTSSLLSNSPSLSLKQQQGPSSSPLSSVGLPSLKAPSQHTPPQASVTRFPTTGPTPPSPIGIRPSPPFTPSSLGDRPLSSGDSGSNIPSRKRYSSSFGHRYAASGGAASDGSTGSGERSGDRERSASFLSNNTDDDDISEFVQDIDSRKPLSGRRRIQSLNLQREKTITSEGPPMTPLLFSPDREPRLSPLGLVSTSPPAGASPMLTSETEIDEKLKKMNDEFFKSLEGLGGLGSSSSRTRASREDSPRRDYREGPVGQVAAMMLRDRQESISRRGSPRRDLLVLESRRGSSASGSLNEGLGQGSEEVIGRLDFDETTSSRRH